MATPIPEVNRAAKSIYQFPGKTHLKKREEAPATIIIQK